MTYKSNLWIRIKTEILVALEHWKSILLCSVLLIYFVLFVLRNLAYWRSQVSMRGYVLPDLGYEVFSPPFTGWMTAIPDYVTVGQVALGFSVPLLSIMLHPEDRSICCIDIARHYLYYLTLLQVARSGTYMVTSLPDPQSICFPNSSQYNPPTVAQIFYRYSDFVCGDLVFSGHTLTTMGVVMVVMTYSSKVFSPRLAIAAKVLVIVFEILVIPLLLAARRHYSVDVLVSVYLSPFVFYWIGQKMPRTKTHGFGQSYAIVSDPIDRKPVNHAGLETV